MVPDLSKETIRGDGADSLGEGLLERVIAPNVNSVVFDAQESIDRGPFDSAFVLHPGPPRPPARGVYHGTPTSGFSIFTLGGQGEIAQALISEWTDHLRQRAASLGFPVPEALGAPVPWVPGGAVALRTPDAFMAPALWDAIARRTATTSEYVANARALAQDARPTWAEVRANPYRLPRLDSAYLDRINSGRKPTQEWTGGVDSVMEPAAESVSELVIGDGRWLFVRWPMADLFGSHSAAEHGVRPVGWALVEGNPCVVFDARFEAAAQPEINLLRLEGCTVQIPPQPRGQPSIQRALPEPATTVYRDGTPFTTVDPDARGPRLVRLQWRDAQGAERSRWAAWTVADPVQVEVPRHALIGAKSVEIPVRVNGLPNGSLVVRWETPPGWSVPSESATQDGVRTFTLTAPDGPLDQELRCVVEGPVGWSRRVSIRVARRPEPEAFRLEFGASGLPSASGTTRVLRGADPEAGPVLEVRDPVGGRDGAVDLLKMADAQPVFLAEVHPYISIRLLAAEAEPYDLCFDTAEGTVAVRLADVPGALAGDRFAAAVGGPWSGWRTVTIDVRQAGVKGPVSRVWLRTPPAAGDSERTRPASILKIASLVVASAAPEHVDALVPGAEAPASEAGSVWQRAAWASEHPTAAALRSSDLPVAFAAAAALRTVRSAETVPALAELLRSLQSGMVLEAARALAFQDTSEAWDALRKALDAGPSFAAKWGACEAFRARPEPALAADLTGLLVASDPYARIAGAEALAALKGPNPAQMLMVFLQDVDPLVRRAVVRLADMDEEVAARRVQYESVNDPSDSVRAESYLSLTRSKIPGLKAEGLKGVRDDSPSVRLQLLVAFAAQRDASFGPAFALAVADIDPRVRAAALSGYASLPGNVAPGELGGVWQERDPRVQRALIELVESKKFPVPEATLVVLRDSVDPRVAQWARDRQP